MTRSKFIRKGGLLTGFTLSGHTGAGEKGEDIVCAAVSSAAYMTANTLTEICHSGAAIRRRNGQMALWLPVQASVSCRPLMEGFLLHLTELQKQYPEHIQVIITEV